MVLITMAPIIIDPKTKREALEAWKQVQTRSRELTRAELMQLAYNVRKFQMGTEAHLIRLPPGSDSKPPPDLQSMFDSLPSPSQSQSSSPQGTPPGPGRTFRSV
jgi:hypothetical protein